RDGTLVSVGNEQYQYWESTGWNRKAGSYDSGWVNGSFKSGWGSYKGSSAYVYCRKVSLGPVFLVDVRIRVSRTGGTRTIFSTGNIGDIAVAQLPSGFAPDGPSAGLQGGFGSRMASGYVGGNGTVVFALTAAGTSTQDIVNGDYFAFSGTYIVSE